MLATKQASEENQVRLLLPVVLALAVLVSGASRSEAARSEVALEKVRRDMSKFAVELKTWLQDQGQESKKGIVLMSPTFQNLPEFATNPFGGLSYMLKQELDRADVPLRTKGSLGLTGKLYRFPEEGDIDKIEKLTIAMEIVKGNRRIYHEDLIVTDRATIALITGNDSVKIERTRCFNGDYGAEILVDGKPCPVKEDRDGIPFVALKLNDQYTIRLINQSKNEAAVWVGIDGLSMFAFNEELEPDGRWRDYRVLVPGREAGGAEGVLPVSGWYFHNREGGTRRFMVTDYPESAACLKGMAAAQLGMITLQFFESFPKGAKRPGTGLGDTITQRWTKKERLIGKLKATITIRYDKE